MSKAVRAISREWTILKEVLHSPDTREVLLWCLPALAAGALLRAALVIHFPYGYFQGDSSDFLVTAERFVKNHSFAIHGKKAFLAPVCFTIPFLLHIPALIVIPLLQHLAGLVATCLAGALVRCWFAKWRWFIIPATLLYTINPALLWYEHALLAECHYLFCVTALALAGTLMMRRPSARRFVWLVAALFFTAGSRPEGKLFVAFGIGVVALAYLGSDVRKWLIRVGTMILCSALIALSSRSNQAGLLLYATVLPLAPEHSTVAPGVEPYLDQIRKDAEAKDVRIRTRLNSVEKKTNNALGQYLKSQDQRSDDAHINKLAQKLAIETIGRHPGLLPVIAANKYLMPCRPTIQGDYTPTSVGYDANALYEKQLEAFERAKTLKPLMRGLTGRDLHGREETLAFLHEKYSPLDPDWFAPLQQYWTRAMLGGQIGSHGADKRFIPTWPAMCLLGVAGMLASLVPRRATPGTWRVHLAWVPTFAGVWFAVMLTGVVNPRYRFVFEPFFLLYALLLLDYLWSGVAAMAGRRPSPPTPQ